MLRRNLIPAAAAASFAAPAIVSRAALGQTLRKVKMGSAFTTTTNAAFLMPALLKPEGIDLELVMFPSLVQRMQAVAWAMAGASTGIAGALIATFFYTSPTVGETLAIIAFVTVSFGGFGSVLGALVAGLIIGVVESLSAYLVGPVYKDVIVYVLFVLVLWFRPQGLMGKA